MQSTSIYYRFTQSFRVRAERAFKWCTDYEATDVKLMHENGNRSVTKFSENVFLLIDSSTASYGNRTSKTRLVCLYPEELFWTSTTIAGTNKYSQFLYRIITDGKDRSKLEFIGLHLEARKISKSQTRSLEQKRKRIVSATWKHLARAMEKDTS